MQIKISRAQIKRNQIGIDTTVKSAQTQAKAFAPTWPMVMGHKAGTISDDAYTALYMEILRRVTPDTWQWLYEQGVDESQVIMLCYCKNGRLNGGFCHTDLIIDFACEFHPLLFVDARVKIIPQQIGLDDF